MYTVATKQAHVKTVELGNAVFRDELRDARIPLGHPSKELGDTHDCGRLLAIGGCASVAVKWRRFL